MEVPVETEQAVTKWSAVGCFSVNEQAVTEWSGDGGSSINGTGCDRVVWRWRFQ